MDSRELRSKVWMEGNKIYFFSDFEEQAINELFRLVEKGKDQKDLTLVLKSFGGSVAEFRTANDLVKRYDIRVHAVGYIMSAGFYLWCAANRRSAEPSTSFMYHEMNYGTYREPLTDHKVKLELSEKDQAWLDSIVTDTGGFTQEELDKIKKTRENDYYFNYPEAVERGLITEENDYSRKEGLKISKVEVNE